MAWCHLAPNHYLNQCWPRYSSPHGTTRTQWVNRLHFLSVPGGYKQWFAWRNGRLEDGKHINLVVKRHVTCYNANKCLYFLYTSSICLRVQVEPGCRGPGPGFHCPSAKWGPRLVLNTTTRVSCSRPRGVSPRQSLPLIKERALAGGGFHHCLWIIL